MHDMKEKLSILWVFAVLNYFYADVIALFDPAVISQLMTGHTAHFTLLRAFARHLDLHGNSHSHGCSVPREYAGRNRR